MSELRRPAAGVLHAVHAGRNDARQLSPEPGRRPRGQPQRRRAEVYVDQLRSSHDVHQEARFVFAFDTVFGTYLPTYLPIGLCPMNSVTR